MSDASDDVTGEGADGAEAAQADASTDEVDIEALREQVDAEYDFDDFGPQDMAQMSADEWDAAFDPDTWITGEELLDRVEADLKNRVARRDVFARVERFDDLLIAYSDSGYAAVYADGSVEGSGTVLRDVKPTVALCSMDSYEVPEMPEGEVLPKPQEVPESSDALGNTVLQVVAAAQVLAGLALLAGWLLYSLGILQQSGTNTRGLNLSLIVVAGIGFIGIGIFLFVTVANARLSDKFRAEEFRNRLRAVGVEDGQRPEFLDDLEGVDGKLPEGLREDLATLGDDTDEESMEDDTEETGETTPDQNEEEDASSRPV
jgi:hypothetical protein